MKDKIFLIICIVLSILILTLLVIFGMFYQKLVELTQLIFELLLYMTTC